MKNKLLLGVVVIALISFTAAGISSANRTKDRLELNQVQLNNRASQIKLEQLKSKALYDKLNSNSAKTEQQIQEYKQQLEDSKKREDDLNHQLQAKLDAKNKLAQAQQTAIQAVTQTQTVAAAPVSANAAKAFIYAHESGNRTDAINAGSGACGLGQALPCSKMPCSLSDYACQDAFFTNYAMGRYGSWEAAQAFWLVHKWW